MRPEGADYGTDRIVAADTDSVCVVIYPGLPGATGCVDLEPDTAGAVPPVSYAWNTGDTTSSITVCPTATTVYSVEVTDTGGVFSLTHFVVHIGNDPICGDTNSSPPNVYVCHVPPGNPAAAHTICIGWRAVPAHVASYRTGNMNPNHGHNSGCRIGECGTIPCN